MRPSNDSQEVSCFTTELFPSRLLNSQTADRRHFKSISGWVLGLARKTDSRHFAHPSPNSYRGAKKVRKLMASLLHERDGARYRKLKTTWRAPMTCLRPPQTWCSALHQPSGEYQPKGGDALWLGSKGRYGLCVGGR